MRVCAALLLAAWLGGCATPQGQVVLLPDTAGRDTAVTVKQEGGELRLDKPYAAADLSSTGPKPATSSAAQVQSRYGAALAARPLPLAQFTLYTTWVLHNSFKFGWGPTENGWSLFVVGVVAAALILLLTWTTGIADTITWVPPIFLAIIILGFCTWEGGLIGIQKPHSDFIRFQDTLRSGKHVLLVDVSADQEHILHQVTNEHPKLSPAGEGHSTPGWFLGARGLFEQIIKGTAWRHH